MKLTSISVPEKSPRSDLKLGIFCLFFDNSLQFEPVVGDMSSERSRSIELAEKIARKEPLDINKVLSEEETGSSKLSSKLSQRLLGSLLGTHHLAATCIYPMPIPIIPVPESRCESSPGPVLKW